MRKFKPTILFLMVIAILTLTSFHSLEHDWVLKKYGNGVSVYSLSLDTSSIKELKSICQIKTSLSSIIALLDDRESYPKWVYKCGESHLLIKINEAEGMYYQSVMAPWPVDNRDFVVRVKTVQDAETKVIYQSSKCLPTFIPKKDGYIRITEFKAVWTLTPLKNGVVNCQYELLVNPGGSVPAWLVNLAAVDGPYETMVNLKEWVMKDKYQKATFPFIKEP